MFFALFAGPVSLQIYCCTQGSHIHASVFWGGFYFGLACTGGESSRTFTELSIAFFSWPAENTQSNNDNRRLPPVYRFAKLRVSRMPCSILFDTAKLWSVCFSCRWRTNKNQLFVGFRVFKRKSLAGLLWAQTSKNCQSAGLVSPFAFYSIKRNETFPFFFFENNYFVARSGRGDCRRRKGSTPCSRKCVASNKIAGEQ